MSSIEELKVVRLYRAYNTIIQICNQRGYSIRHPKVVAEAVKDPELYDAEEGLDYDWFLKHFVITPAQAKVASSSRSAKRRKEEAAEEAEDEAAAADAELMRRAAGGEWVVMRNALRLSCARADGPKPRQSSGGVSSSPETDAEGKKGATELLVFFSSTPTLSIKEVQDCREKALKKGSTQMMMVTNKVTGVVQRDVNELSGRLDVRTGKELLRIQVFEEDALAFNGYHHETVPTHVALSEEEATAFLESRKLNISQLPRMLESDPVVQYLGLSRGRIVRIERNGKESGKYDMYRQVI